MELVVLLLSICLVNVLMSLWLFCVVVMLVCLM